MDPGEEDRSDAIADKERKEATALYGLRPCLHPLDAIRMARRSNKEEESLHGAQQ
jgi:hypothetical protein